LPVKFEQKEIGTPTYGCDFPPIDFVAFCESVWRDVFRCERPDEIRPAARAALISPKPALVEAMVDANEKPTKPERLENLEA
jgi:thiamine pyrophosphate-dependent acetolactate synthase large subunit-like protein